MTHDNHSTHRARPAVGRSLAPSILATLAAALLGACGGNHAAGALSGAPRADVVDSAALLADIGRLAHDSLRGRLSGTPENVKARDFIAARFDRLALGTVGAGRTRHFTFTRRRDSATVAAANVIGVVRGTESPERYIVVTAHFDHVGVGRPVGGDSIYNGADDNASGAAALLALAEHFSREPARHSLLFVALDAEEQGLQGARAFVADPPVPREAMVLNVNMDMVSHSERGELYAAGASRYPRLRAPLERAARGAPVTLLLGHDTPEPTPRDDWTMQSDQGAFHQAGIPFVYFGVEDHPDYHRPSDEVGTITPGFYVGAVKTIARAIRELDRL
ncbi:MAG TPA: M28 family peptidase [Gemmatimonadales bacterium]